MILLIFYCKTADAQIGISQWTPILQLAFTSLRWMSRWANPMPQLSGCPNGLFAQFTNLVMCLMNTPLIGYNNAMTASEWTQS